MNEILKDAMRAIAGEFGYIESAMMYIELAENGSHVLSFNTPPNTPELEAEEIEHVWHVALSDWPDLRKVETLKLEHLGDVLTWNFMIPKKIK